MPETPSCTTCLHRPDCEFGKIHGYPTFTFLDIVEAYIAEQYPDIAGLKIWIGLCSCPKYKEKVVSQTWKQARKDSADEISPELARALLKVLSV